MLIGKKDKIEGPGDIVSRGLKWLNSDYVYQREEKW